MSDSESENTDFSDEDEGVLLSQRQEGAYEQNAAAIMTGAVEVKREAVHGSLTIKGQETLVPVQRNFSVPRQDLKKAVIVAHRPNARKLRLGARGWKRLVNNTTTIPRTSPLPVTVPDSIEAKATVSVPQKVLVPEVPDTGERLALWEPTEEEIKEHNWSPIRVPSFLTTTLRPHQREGVRFMAECVLKQRDFAGAGVILADDMGLGKTLQSITLLYTLMTEGFGDTAVVQRAIVICPTSLVTNWRNEITKWLGTRLPIVAVVDTTIDDIESDMSTFMSASNNKNVLIASYESVRRCVDTLAKYKQSVDLMICDEAHRLKNDQTRTYQALNSIKCERRILLSGTPLQNDLNEFYSMIDFTCPKVIGQKAVFNKYYQTPILEGREPYALQSEIKLGMKRSAELSAIVNDFVLRRTNVLLSKHLPPKVVQIVCCPSTPLQEQLYHRLLQSKDAKKLMAQSEEEGGRKSTILPLLNNLKSLCNHPYLLYTALTKNGKKSKSKMVTDISNMSPPSYVRGSYGAADSGKMRVLEKLLQNVRRTSQDRIVFISNYTQTLDIFESVCQQNNWSFVRLDGSTSVKNRQKKVDQFNGKGGGKATKSTTSLMPGGGRSMLGGSSSSSSAVLKPGKFSHGSFRKKLKPTPTVSSSSSAAGVVDTTRYNNNIGNLPFAFLLSSKAGGCGINLVGANRLILYDPDWNPAVDKQASARIWRDGQKKRCFIYRFLTTGSIEEKIYQRQLSKEGLADVLGGTTSKALVSTEDLRKLFTLEKDTPASTHDYLACECAGDGSGVKYDRGQRGLPKEEDLLNWAHHSTTQTTPDPALRQAFQALSLQQATDEKASDGNARTSKQVSFVFSNEVDGKSIGEIDAKGAAAVSAKCDDEPVFPDKEEENGEMIEVPIVTAAEAQAKLKVYVDAEDAKRRYRRKKKAGRDTDDSDVDSDAPPMPARRSGRAKIATARYGQTRQEKWDAKENDDRENSQSAEVDLSTVGDDVDEESLKMIRQVLAEDKQAVNKPRTRKKQGKKRKVMASSSSESSSSSSSDADSDVDMTTESVAAKTSVMDLTTTVSESQQRSTLSTLAELKVLNATKENVPSVAMSDDDDDDDDFM